MLGVWVNTIAIIVGSLVVIMVIGAVIGTFLDLDSHLETLGKKLKAGSKAIKILR